MHFAHKRPIPTPKKYHCAIADVGSSYCLQVMILPGSWDGGSQRPVGQEKVYTYFGQEES